MEAVRQPWFANCKMQNQMGAPRREGGSVRIFDIVVAGLVATSAMVVFMQAIHRRGWANADMIRAIGSILTRSEKEAWKPGVVIHYTIGVFFAFAYSVLLAISPASSFLGVLVLSTFIGMVHGVVVGLMLTILVAEHHPLERFQHAGAGVVIAHKLGHVVYGFTVGLTLGLVGSPIARRSGTAAVPLEEMLGISAEWLLLLGAPMLILALTIIPWVRQHKHVEA
jgi:hypothetical protein